MAYRSERGTCFLLRTGGTDDNPDYHLFIQLTLPSGPDNEVLIVTVSSVKDGLPFDETCCLDIGDLEFVTRPSYIRFAKTRLVKIEALTNLARQNKLVMKQYSASEQLLRRIRRGFRDSLDVPPVFKTILEFDAQADDP